MKFELRTSINIDAKPEAVWNVFSDFDQYPEWNPFVKSLKGNLQEGNTIAVDLPGMNFKPIVLEWKKNKILKWKGKLLFRGLFDGEHYFELVEKTDGTTEFIHGENFSGLLVSSFKKKLEGEVKEGFVAMNEALKERVEASQR